MDSNIYLEIILDKKIIKQIKIQIKIPCFSLFFEFIEVF
jgi:hypothetical protein